MSESYGLHYSFTLSISSMPDHTLSTPGVYVSEITGPILGVAPVATAIPVFIGYTPSAQLDGTSYLQKAHKVSSFREFNDIYGVADDSLSKALPNYNLHEVETEPLDGNFVQVGLAYYHMIADPNTQYYLYHSVKLFFDNGGNEAYIMAVGNYGEPTQNFENIGKTIVNANVSLRELQQGIALLKNIPEITMYLCPDATLLSVKENGSLMQAMLLQQSQLKTGICIFDIIGSKHPDPIQILDPVTIFRENTGNIGLSFGTAYYPFIGTTLVQKGDLFYTNFFAGHLKTLDGFLRMDLGAHADLDMVMKEIMDPNSTQTASHKNKMLLSVSPLYRELVALATTMANLQPPSGAMAGVMATTDATSGVWKAPANVSIVGVHTIPINLNNQQQADFNVDAITGKSINVIRNFPGMGTLVWGARTLNGNSLDWKYINVRRTMSFIEQSCMLAIKAYVFEPNTANTWNNIKAMISNFLQDLWRQGAFMGAKPSEVFAVKCGLGSTMTAQDIAQGELKVLIMVAPMRPAEFIVLSFTQKMSTTP